MHQLLLGGRVQRQRVQKIQRNAEICRLSNLNRSPSEYTQIEIKCYNSGAKSGCAKQDVKTPPHERAQETHAKKSFLLRHLTLSVQKRFLRQNLCKN